MSGKECAMQVKTTVVVKSKKASSLSAFSSLVATMLCLTGGAANLTIEGGSTEIWTGETKNYGWIKIGSENGNGTLVAVNSTINLSDSSASMYVGYEKSPGYSGLAAQMFLTNTALTCSGEIYLGCDVAAGGSISAEIGPGSVVTCSRIHRYCSPSPTLVFTGGRMVFNGNENAGIFYVRGHTWSGSYVNGGLTARGEGAPIDIEIPNTRRLVVGWANRFVNLGGNGGLVKRGAGTLIWGWHTTGNNVGFVGGDVNYTGSTVIKEGGIRLATPSDVALSEIACHTPTASPLVIEEGAFFDFAGTDAAWVSVSGEGILTNSSESAATLTLGNGNADCSLEVAESVGAINVMKTGTGTLTLSLPEIDGNLTVAGGTLKVKSSTSFAVGSITAANGTTLDFRGATVRCGDFNAPSGVTILCDDDTDLNYTLNTETATRLLSGTLPARGDLAKTGPGTLTLVGPCAKTGGSVNIEAGVVACETAQPFKGKFFRLNYGRAVKESDGWANDNKTVQFSEFSLYGVGGMRINAGGFSYTPITGTATLPYEGYDGIADASTLLEREVAVWMPTHDQFFNYDTNSKYDGSPLAVFDGNTTTKLRNTSYWESSSIIVFRMEADAEDAIGFTFTTSDFPIRRPNEWTLDGSVDGTSWTTLAVRTADASLTDEEKWLWRTNSTPDTAYTEYNGGFPYTFDSLPAPIRYAPFGAATVSVAEGATLQLDSTMTLSSLRVDMDGAGTITTFAPSENGALYLENVQGDRIGGEVALPLNVSSVVGPTALKTWTVHVNGSPTDYIVRWNGLNLIVGPKPGLVLSYR